MSCKYLFSTDKNSFFLRFVVIYCICTRNTFTFCFILNMVDLKQSYAELFSRNGSNSDSNHLRINKGTVNIIFTFGVLGIVLIIISIVSYRVFRINYINRRPKNQRQSTHISSVYVVLVRSDLVPSVIEEPPPAYYSVVQLQERESNPTVHF
jgi:hypothetical protein